MGAELSAEWRSHVLAVRGPALVAIGLQVAQLLLRPIPSEVSSLDQALSGDAVRHPDRGTQLLMHTMLPQTDWRDFAKAKARKRELPKLGAAAFPECDCL